METFRFRAFLSHRYKSPEVNLYFHKLFAETAEVQFEVDESDGDLNVTCLERMIRDAHAFIGIYPFAGDPDEPASSEKLRAVSKYFRLECELAVRSGKPTMVFLDKRYARVFDLPPMVRKETFDLRDISGAGESSKAGKFRTIFRQFCEEVTARKDAIDLQPGRISEMKVGIVVPTDGPPGCFYEPEDIETIEQAIDSHGANPKVYSWPPSLHHDFLAEVDELDWVVLDIGAAAMSSGIVGFLHGRFIPSIRLVKTPSTREEVRSDSTFQPLFGGIEVGYCKDAVVWNDRETLGKELKGRLDAMNLLKGFSLFKTNKDAENYFQRAAKRDEIVFLSYSGKDYDLASEIYDELSKRFEKVFNYRDGESITPGQPWMEEIFDNLAASHLGISLVSSSYLASGNCEHEARSMVAKEDSRELVMFPLKLHRDDKFDPPSWMRETQYMHLYDYEDARHAVDKLIEFFDRAQEKSRKTGGSG